jgi:exodeoxyribonuclease V alpha subunit
MRNGNQQVESSRDAVAGLIERVTFHNEESGFAVLRVKVKGRRDLVTVVGALAAVSAGEWINAEGRWARDREHGMQLKAEQIELQPPNSAEGIEKYLASGMIKGIGPTYAKKLVERFGERIFEIIESESARLEEIEGIGPERRRSIKQAWAEQRVVRDIMVFLHAQGLGTSRAVRIYKTYGEEAIERIRSNPYSLAKDIQGIGFKSADAVAERLGMARDSLLRIRAGIDHMLLLASGEGHCAMPRARLIASASELLGVAGALVESALDAHVARGEVTIETIEGEELVFLPALQSSETVIAERIRSLARRPAAYPAIELEKALAWVQEKTGKELSPSQAEALRMAVTQRIAIITGGPGVGKTTLVNAILRVLRAKRVRCVLCAPTGRAAKRLGESAGIEARTIHRLLEPLPGGGFRRDERNPIEADLLVVDEISMIDVPLMARLLRALPAHGSLLLVGDADQLPSVGPGMVLRDLLASGVAPVTRLETVFRQAGESRIVQAAHAINEGVMPASGTDDADDFFFIERSESADAAELIVDLVAERLPKRYGFDPRLDIQVLSPMNRGVTGVRAMNAALQDRLNPARDGVERIERFGIEFRAGDKVLQTRNDYDKEVFNGDIGVVSGVWAAEREMGVRFDGREVRYDFGELDELELAYAITVHKSQGSEFPCVVIPLAGEQFLLLQRNLLYTAVTRGKRLVVLAGQRKAFAMAVRNATIRERCSGLLSRLKERPARPL